MPLDEMLARFKVMSTGEEPSVELGPGETSLHFFQKVYRDPQQPMPRRMAAAKEAQPFEHPKLSAMQVVHANAEQLEQEIRRREAYTQSWYDNHPDLRPLKPPKVIEGEAVEVRESDPRD
jgi:RecA-family ATPase